MTGQVSNAATRAFLEGAEVRLVGTNRTAITDREGWFQFGNVPEGVATLRVSYTGLDAQDVPVTVLAGQTVSAHVQLTSQIYALEEYTVAGMREGTALAETLQRQAPNVKLVVSSDTFGNVADGNVGDLLQRMAGITADYNGPDVRQVSIRGVGANLNSVTMDGQQVASAQSAGVGRAFEFEQASLGNIETIEVTKAPTPDMPGASIGGSVNLVTKSAFDRAPGRIINYSLGFVTRPTKGRPSSAWKQPIHGYGPSTNIMYSDVIGPNQNIGITLTGTYHSQPPINAITAYSMERKTDPGPVFTYSGTRNLGGATRTRLATGAKIDYKWSDQTIVTLNTSYNFFHENNHTAANALTTTGVATNAVPQVLATVNANGDRISGGYIHPNYADGITRIFPHPTLSFSNLSVTTNDKSGRTILLSPSVRHRFEGMNIDYGISYSNAATYYDVSHRNDKFKSRPKGTVTARLNNIGWIIDRSRDPNFATYTQTHGPDMYDLNNYGNLVLAQNDRRGYDTVVAGRFDLRKDLDTDLPMFIKTGVLYQEQRRKLSGINTRFNFLGPDGLVNSGDEQLGQFFDTTRGGNQAIEDKYFVPRGGAPVFPNPYAVARHQRDYPELWREDIAFATQNTLLSRREATETIPSAYLMANVRWGHLSVLTGIRYEETRLEAEGPVTYLSPEEQARRAAWVGPVTDAEARRRAEAQYGGRATNKGKYDNFFPGVHLKYEPLAGLVTRLSWSTGIGRPGFGSIIPLETVNDDTMRVTASNPNLKPQEANNYDVSIEYYFRPQGVLSAGAFKKKIKNHIFTDTTGIIPEGPDNGFNGEYGGYALTTSRNGGFADIEGFEFSYQQQLSFLPGIWKGLGISMNYTQLKTEGDYGGSRVASTNTLAGFLPRSANVGLSYIGHGFDLRLQAVHRGEYLATYNANPSLLIYQVKKTTWVWKSRYAFSRKLNVFFDVENIFGVPLDDRFALFKDRTSNYRIFDPKIVMGISGRL